MRRERGTLTIASQFIETKARALISLVPIFLMLWIVFADESGIQGRYPPSRPTLRFVVARATSNSGQDIPPGRTP